MLLASHAILRVSSAVKRYSQIKTVSFFSANTRLGTGNQFFFFFFFPLWLPLFYENMCWQTEMELLRWDTGRRHDARWRPWREVNIYLSVSSSCVPRSQRRCSSGATSGWWCSKAKGEVCVGDPSWKAGGFIYYFFFLPGSQPEKSPVCNFITSL